MNNPLLTLSPLTILNWNANGLLQKGDELKSFILEHNIDVCIITETHTKPGQSFKMANYNIYRCDRIHHRGGGSAILAKRSISTSLYRCSNDRGFEETTVRMSINNYNFNISAVYSPPDKKLEINDIKYLFPSSICTIVGGDLNTKHSHWGCRTTNPNGKNLYPIINDLFLNVVAPPNPTYYPNNVNHRPDILDIFITNTPFNMCADVINDLSSDHLPVLATLGIPKSSNQQLKTTTDWRLYYNILSIKKHKDLPLENSSHIENSIQEFTNDLCHAHAESTSTFPTNLNYLILPRQIKMLIQHRNWLRKRYQRTLDPKIKREVNKLNRLIKENCKIHRQQRWEEKVVTLCTEDNSIWKMSKCLRISTPVNRPILGDSGPVYCDEEKAEAFADEMEKQFSENSEPSNDEYYEIVKRDVTTFIGFHRGIVTLEPTNRNEVLEIISKLKTKKAPGKDKVNNSMIRNMPDTSISRLMLIINTCLEQVYFPQLWKEASIIMIQKPHKNPSLPSSYRPISLLSVLAKIYERIISGRIKPYLNIIPSEQYGFLQGKSTTKQLVRILEFIGSAAHNKQSSALLMLDVAKAFDRVWHFGLIHKLINCNLSPELIVLIHSYLTNRTFNIKFGNAMSTMRQINAGVPQGSILGPILYLFYTSDFPTFNQDHNCLTAFYADDTAVVTKSRDPNHAVAKLQDKVEEIEDWCEKWKVAINAQKSKILVIRKHKIGSVISNTITLFNDTIPIVKQANYLGLIFNEKLNWKDHCKNVTGKAKGAMARLRPILGRKSILPLNQKRLVYTSTIRPILTYASPALTTLNSTEIKILQTCQNKILREMVNASRYIRNALIHRDLAIEPIETHLAQLNTKFYDRALNKVDDFNEILQYEILREDSTLRPFAAFYLSDAALALHH